LNSGPGLEKAVS